jgi:predicted HD superfamily hydrolase involved in NAD metabolism
LKRLKLDPERLKQSLRVEKVALRLGQRWRVDKKKIIVAALLHDCARRFNGQQLLKVARKLGLKIDPVRKYQPKLFHAEISAYLAKKEFGVKSKEVLRAIRFHTTGAPKMTKLEKIIYLADHIEEGRNFPGVKKMRKLAFENLDLAILESTHQMLRYLLRENLPIYPQTIETRNYYLYKFLRSKP